MSKKVVDYYTEIFSENERHEDGFGQIQRQRTLNIFKQYLQGKPRKIIDIGGATGAYSFDLAKAGHNVHLLDIVPAHIEKAERIGLDKGILLDGYHVGDAKDLEFEDNSFDAVILHGPLYHITGLVERKKVLNEALRILKPNGVLFGFAINRYAGVFYGIHNELILDDTYFEMVKTEVETGFRTRNPTWHFHLPEELEAEITSSGFKIEATKGVVSPVWMLPDIESKLADAEMHEKIIRVCELLENEPKIGQDFVCIGRKQ